MKKKLLYILCTIIAIMVGACANPTVSKETTATIPPTNIPTLTPTNIPTLTPTNTPTLTPTNTPTPTPTNTPTPTPTNTPTPTPILDDAYWFNLYKEVIYKYADDNEYFTLALIYLDNDIIPELVINLTDWFGYPCSALYTIQNNQPVNIPIDGYEEIEESTYGDFMAYREKEGLFYRAFVASDGYYGENIYKYENNVVIEEPSDSVIDWTNRIEEEYIYYNDFLELIQ